jgi:hypothetical protein
MTDVIVNALSYASVVIIWAALFAYLTRRIKVLVMFGWDAVAWGLYTLVMVLRHETGGSCFVAGVTAVFAWLWWANGGGDDTKKRLRKIAKRFEPVRRTAPQGA